MVGWLTGLVDCIGLCSNNNNNNSNNNNNNGWLID